MKHLRFLCAAFGLALSVSASSQVEAGVISRLLGSNQRGSAIQQATYASPTPTVPVAYTPPMMAAPLAATPTQVFNPPLNTTEIEANIAESARLEGRGVLQNVNRSVPPAGGPAPAPSAPGKALPMPAAPAKSGY
jgi:hypothetical protein